MTRLPTALLALITAGFALPAFAHPFHGGAADFAAGYTHPFLGLDHLLAMLAVGIWAMRAGGGAVIRAPLFFCAAVVLGAALGYSGLAVPGVEPLVAASVLALGLLIAVQSGGARPYAIALIALFGLFHGLAHGVEQASAAAVLTLVGLVLASVTLHAAGAAAAYALDQRVRASGVALMAAGAWLLMHA